MASVSLTERCRGAFLGLAWGDVLGCPVEGLREEEIRTLYGHYSDLPEAYPLAAIGQRSRQRLRPLGLYSDDAQQAMALIEVCLAPPGWSPTAWGDCLVSGMIAGAWRGYGRNFAGAVNRLRSGTCPEASGSPAAGLGAAMRSGPLGAIYRDQPERLAEISFAASLTTHGDVRAAAMAFAVAWAVAALINGQSCAAVAQALPAAVAAQEPAWVQGHEEWQHDRAGEQAVTSVLELVLPYLGDKPKELRRQIVVAAGPYLAGRPDRAHPNHGFALLGGVHALAMGLQPSGTPRELLGEIIRQGHDTDTVAAIAGSLLGARFGASWIPTNRCCDETRLLTYAEALVSRQGPPEDLPAFLAREAYWTKEEDLFQMWNCCWRIG